MYNHFTNVTSGIKDAAREAPGRAAFKFGDTVISCGNLDQIVSRIVTWLIEQGVEEGDVVALRLSQQSKLIPALLAVMRIGAAGMVLAPIHSNERRRDLLEQAGVKLLVSETDSLLQTPFPGIVLPSWSKIASMTKSEVISENPDLICSIIVGSGSTGEPRLMPLSQRALHSRTEIRQSVLNIQFDERLMLLSPAQFSSFFEYSLVASLNGGTSVFWDQKTTIIDAIRLEQPDVLHLTAFHAQQLVSEALYEKDFCLSGIRLVTVSSSPVSDTLRGKLAEDLGANLCVVYGANETGPLTATELHQGTSAHSSIGRPVDRVKLEIVSENHTPVPAGETGQIRVKSPGAISEYFKATTKTNFIDEWFYPRDLAQSSEDGELIFMGRSDHMMIFDGINIYPPQIENALELHGAVAEAAAYSIQDETHGDIPLCAIVPAHGHKVDVNELTGFARQKLGNTAPRGITVLETIPRTQQGKIDRRALSALATKDGKLNSPVAKAPMLAVSYPANLLPQPRQCRVLRQTAVVAPDNLSFKHLDTWEKYLVDTLSPGRYTDVDLGIDGPDSSVVMWLRVVQKATAFLLIQSRIPCFEPFLLAEIAKREGKERIYDVVFEHPQFLNYKPGTISTALKEAFAVVHFMRANPANAKNREVFWTAVSKRSVPRIASDNVVNSSTVRVLFEAYKKRIPFTHLGRGVYQLGWGAASRLISASTTESESVIGSKLAGSKLVTAAVLRRAGLPAPRHFAISTVEEASAAAEALGYPVVVKPIDLERGEGIALDITPTSLRNAVLRTLELSSAKRILIEKQVPGVCHRLFVSDGRILYAVKRLPIGVYGDGTRSVQALVEQAFAADIALPPWERSKIQLIDQLARVALSRENRTPDMIPENGQFVPLRRIESTAEGGVDEDVSDMIHPENTNVALEAARQLGLSVCGIDIITEDISRPWMETGAIINEANYSPSLGSAEISRRHLGKYIDGVLSGSGRIPVEVFVGRNGAMTEALNYLRFMKAKGINAYVTSDSQTLNSSEEPHYLAVDTLTARVRALVSLKSVEALAIVLESVSFLEQPLPLEFVDKVHWIEDPFGIKQAADSQLRIATLRDLMDSWQFDPSQSDIPSVMEH